MNDILAGPPQDNTVSFIDGKTNTVIATIKEGTSPKAVSVNPSINMAYATNSGDNTVSWTSFCW